MINHQKDEAPSYWLSDISPGIFPPPAGLPSKTEVIVIGGGLMGISVAYWLARFGLDTLLLESRWLCWGATGRNAGLLLAGCSLLEDPSLLEDVLSRERIEAEYTTPGHLVLASSEEIWDKIRAEASSPQNTPKRLHALERSSCEHLLKMRIAKGFRGGRWFPKGGTIHSTRFAYGLARSAARYGALIAQQTRVLGIKRAADHLSVLTTRGEVCTNHVVYACNAWITELIPAFTKVITPVCGQVLSTRPLPPIFNVGLAVDWGTVYWRQTADGTIVLGGCGNDKQGSRVGCQELVSAQIQQDLVNFLPKAFPEFPTFTVAKRWAGIMDCSKDGKPLVGRLPSSSNEWVITGFNGHGMPLGLGIGKAVAEGIATNDVPARLVPFSPLRFPELVLTDS